MSKFGLKRFEVALLLFAFVLWGGSLTGFVKGASLRKEALGQPLPTTGSLLGLEGEVRRAHEREIRFRRVQPNDAILLKDGLLTLENSSAKIALVDQSVLTMGPTSMIRLAGRATGLASGQALIQLVGGSLSVKAAQQPVLVQVGDRDFFVEPNRARRFELSNEMPAGPENPAKVVELPE